MACCRSRARCLVRPAEQHVGMPIPHRWTLGMGGPEAGSGPSEPLTPDPERGGAVLVCCARSYVGGT